MSSTRCDGKNKEWLKSLMKEVNLNARVQQKLLNCADAGTSFPFMPKHLFKYEHTSEAKAVEAKHRGLPAKPMQRTKSTIEKLNFYERDRFRPNPSKTRSSEEKERLQNIMAFGKEYDLELRNVRLKETVHAEMLPIDLFSEILMEIEERRQFLEDMQKIGMHKKYMPEIQCQIALRLKDLEKLDKDRAQKLLL